MCRSPYLSKYNAVGHSLYSKYNFSRTPYRSLAVGERVAEMRPLIPSVASTGVHITFYLQPGYYSCEKTGRINRTAC